MMTAVSGRLLGMLRDIYRPPEWAMAYEVQAPAEDGGLRFADAVALNTRKASGQPLIGFELKTSRADLLTELKDPNKHLAASTLCDHWYLVVGDAVIIQDLPIPLPPLWGTIVPDGDGGLKITKHAALRVHGKVRPPLDRALVAAMFNRILNDPDEPKNYWYAKVSKAEQKGYQKGLNAGKRVFRKVEATPRARDDDGELNLP